MCLSVCGVYVSIDQRSTLGIVLIAITLASL